jgi:pyridoxine kinase
MTSETSAAPPAVIVISSHVVRGSVGGRPEIFALESLGFPVWAVPTIVLGWHPGHGRSTRIVPPADQFSALLSDLEQAPWLDEVGAVLSGYFGSPEQAEAVALLVKAVKQRNPRALYVCDPVLGDYAEGLYVQEKTAVAVRDRLMPLADIATPNRFELEWMMRTPLADLKSTIEAAVAAAPPTMLVTSAPSMIADGIANLLVDQKHALLAEHRIIQNPPKGTGDLTCATFLARLLSGQSPEKALQSATATVYEAVARAAKRGSDELQLHLDAQSLSHPMAMVQMRTLLHPSRSRKA